MIAIILLFTATRTLAQPTTDAHLDSIQHGAFTFFWNEANPSNGLIKDRSALNAPCSVASLGFGLSGICIGVDHGWVSRAAARDRVLTALNTLWYSPQGDGVNGYAGMFGLYYHMLDMSTATRTWSSELSTIDTALLLAGILDARQYFDGSDSLETRVRNLADSIYYRMDWNQMRNFNPGILMGWQPTTGFAGYGQWVGYNEASIMYLLALGSPTHPIDSDGWSKWTQGYNFSNEYGQSYVIFPPLFGHQYSQCWIDYRNIADDVMRGHGLTYFENSRRAALAQRAYSIANPGHHAGYSDSLWGITACDGPSGYNARGAPPAQDDDGTIAPTAPVSSIAFAPEVVIPVIHKMWNTYHAQLWTSYGFRDAFNLDVNWWDSDVIGIDEGPMIIMIENYRTQKVWNRFMKNPDVQRGLQKAGFAPMTSVSRLTSTPVIFALQQNYPNPFNPTTKLQYMIGESRFVSVKVHDVLGQEVATLVNEAKEPGEYTVEWNTANCAGGVYFCTMHAGNFVVTRKMLLLK